MSLFALMRMYFNDNKTYNSSIIKDVSDKIAKKIKIYFHKYTVRQKLSDICNGKTRSDEKKNPV